MKKIKYCPECGHYLDEFEYGEKFCKKCGNELTEREPKMLVRVEFESGGRFYPDSITLKDFFSIVKKQRLIE